MKKLCTLALTLAATSAAMATPSEAILRPCAPTATRFASAADYRQEFIPADASTVLHLDFKSLRSSMLGKVVSKMIQERGNEELAELTEKIGFDPFTELDSVTLYGRADDGDSFGALLVGSSALDKVLEKLPEQDAYSAVTKDGIDFFQFPQLVGSWHIMESGERLVMLGRTIDVALRGHQVVHGDVASQGSSSQENSLAQPSKGSILFAVGGGELLKQAQGSLRSSVMELATGGQLELSESNGALHLSIGVQTASREAAQDLRETLGGLLALGRMMLSSNDDMPGELTGLLRSINLIVVDKSVSLSLSVPLEALMQMLQERGR